jgi:hypothetical protein
MSLIAIFFSQIDVVAFPFCILFLWIIIRTKANKNRDPKIRKLYYAAFLFKIVCVTAFAVMTEFYFGGGDTGLFYQATKDLKSAIYDDANNFWIALTTSKLSTEHPFFRYFYYDGYTADFTFGYMRAANNFLPAKLALIPSYVFFNSYLCICMCFGFFALGGAIRLFKAFYYFYPSLYRELSFACLFLPGVAFWTSGLLKDPISFGCIGYIFYSIVNIFFKKTKRPISVVWIIVCGTILFISKVYILLVLVLSIAIWLFTEFNRLIRDRTLRNVFTILMFLFSTIIGYFLVTYLTSFESAQEYRLDLLVSNAERERAGYAAVAQKIQGDSHFEINTSNPFLLVFGGIVATFYRPFFWEINTPVALLSALESSVFLLLTLYFLFKKGVKQFFNVPFADPKILMCFIFSIVFAVAIGSATANFGALSRYKIPCTPFYLIMLLIMYRKTNLRFPAWFDRIINSFSKLIWQNQYRNK